MEPSMTSTPERFWVMTSWAWLDRWRASPTSYRNYDPYYALAAGALTGHLAKRLTDSSVASVASAVIAGAGVFLFCRGVLPDLSLEGLEAAERALMSSVVSDSVEERWTEYATTHASWKIHSFHKVVGPSLPDVVVIHGHSAGSALLVSLFGCLPSCNLHVIDLPGWGRSPLPKVVECCSDPVTIVDHHVEMLRGFLQANNLHRIQLIGHSYGGMLCVAFASKHPSLLSKLVLVSPAALAPVMPSNTFYWALYFRYITPQLLARTLGRFAFVIFKHVYLSKRLGHPLFPDYYFQLAASTAYNGKGDKAMSNFIQFRYRWRGALVGLPFECYWTHPVLSLLLGLDVPLSVVWGERDFLLPSSFGSLIKRLRPNTSLYLIRDAGHNPAHSVPDQFGRVLTAIIDGSSLASDESNGLVVVPAAAPVLPVEHSTSTAHTGVFGSEYSGRVSSIRSVDSVVTTVSGGPGKCLACGWAVHLFGSSWRCGCGYWTYSALPSPKETKDVVQHMEAFLDELHVHGTFNARTCTHITLVPNGIIEAP